MNPGRLISAILIIISNYPYIRFGWTNTSSTTTTELGKTSANLVTLNLANNFGRTCSASRSSGTLTHHITRSHHKITSQSSVKVSSLVLGCHHKIISQSQVSSQDQITITILTSSVWRYPKSEQNWIQNFFPIPNFSNTESNTFFSKLMFIDTDSNTFPKQNVFDTESDTN